MEDGFEVTMHTVDQLCSGELAGARYVRISDGLSSVPHEIIALQDTLEFLDLSGNSLSSLPDNFARLSKLRILFCSDNQFEELPEILGQCPALSVVGFKANRIRNVPAKALPSQLRWLILTNNVLEELPSAIGNCSQLQKLMLAGNRLASLPASLANCYRLELLRIAANRLRELPDWLLSLPRLSWLAYSGNPFGAQSETEALTSAAIDDVPWATLEIEDILGQGASGVIHRATVIGTDGDRRSVAAKLFKGEMTSDGFPLSEMAASIKAGKHPNLISSIARISDHPSGTDGLILELVGSEFANLAGPPSMASCTRDVYAPATRFTLIEALHLSHNIASAAVHLHERGILHGDLYGHNILHDRGRKALIGDFGAASFYDVADHPVADRLQRLEVRAFGCLLEELLDRCAPSSDERSDFDSMNALKLACLSDDIEQRPLFSEIKFRLSEMLGHRERTLAR